VVRVWGPEEDYWLLSHKKEDGGGWRNQGIAKNLPELERGARRVNISIGLNSSHFDRESPMSNGVVGWGGGVGGVFFFETEQKYVAVAKV